MTKAARFAEAMLDADDNLLRDYVFHLCGLDTTTLLTLYTDETKGTVASAVGEATTTDNGDLLVWMDDEPFDLYVHGSVVGSSLVGGTLMFRGLVPTSFPGEERTPVLYTFMVPTNPWVLAHDRDYDPIPVLKDTSGRSFSGDVAYAPGIVTVTFAATQTGTAELT